MVRARRREKREVIPAETAPDMSGRELRAQFGSQKVRVPVEYLMAYFGKTMRGIEEWKQTADPMGQMLYTGIKQSLNIMIPLLREFVKRAPDMPPMPARARHSDPVLYLLGYINAYTIDMFTRGEFTIPVDESGMVTGFDWSYLAEIEAGRGPEVERALIARVGEEKAREILQARARQAELSDASPDEEGRS